MKKPAKNEGLRALITARSFAKRRRSEAEKKTVGGLKDALENLADRSAMVIGREIRAAIAKDAELFDNDPTAEPALRKKLQADVWAELIHDLTATIGPIPAELPEPGFFREAEKVEKHGTWKTAVLDLRHIKRFGERRCEGCQKYTELFDRVSWKIPHGERIWHEKCRPKEKPPNNGEKAKSGLRAFELMEHHIKKHGERNCSTCGQPLELGQMVLWKFGSKNVAHERCGL
jgi:hypothetical protein